MALPRGDPCLLTFFLTACGCSVATMTSSFCSAPPSIASIWTLGLLQKKHTKMCHTQGADGMAVQMGKRLLGHSCCPAVCPRPAHLPPARSPPSSLPCSYCSINPPAPHCLCSLMASVLALASPSLTVALLIYTHTPLLLCAHAAAPVLSQLHLEERPAVPGASEPDCACLATHTSLIECFSRTRGG